MLWTNVRRRPVCHRLVTMFWGSSRTWPAYKLRISGFVSQAGLRPTSSQSLVLRLFALFPCMASADKSRTSQNTSDSSSTPIRRCEYGEKQTRNLSSMCSQRKLMACKKAVLLFLGALAYACDIGSDMCFVYSPISATVSQDESGALWMNCLSHSMRRMSVRWKTSAIKTGNTRTGSFNASRQLPVLFMSKSWESFSHSISLKHQHPNTWRIGAPKIRHTLCYPPVPVCLLLST